MNAQNAYRIDGGQVMVGASHMQELDDGIYWIFETLPTGPGVNGENILRVTEFDDCGALRSFNYTNPGGYGITHINNSFIQGDTLRICLRYIPQSTSHSFPEIGILSINLQDLGHSYHYVRADNSLYSLGFFPTKEGKYFLHTFLSYTDRPIQFSSFLLNKKIEIEKYFENFGWGVVTGSAIEVTDGYFVITGKYIFKLDYGFNPVWIKRITDYCYLGNLYLTDGGVVFRVVVSHNQPVRKREHFAIKMDLEGNIVWQSDNLNYDDQRNSGIKLIKKGDGNFEMAVSKQNNTSIFNKDLVIYTIDQTTGALLKSENSFNTSLVDSFMLKSFYNLKKGGRQLLIEDQNNKTVVWNISENMNCNLEPGGSSLAADPFRLEQVSLTNSIQDELYTGSYSWQLLGGTVEAEIICTDSYELQDLLPLDSLACSETGVLIDLSEIPYRIRWEDGSTDKLRQFNESGSYEYQIEHCDISFEESMNLTLEKCDCQFYLPNAFSPNGDGLNDVFDVMNKCEALDEFQLSIYDRWGNQIYFSDEHNETWDGRFKGKPLGPGLYTYLLEYSSKIALESVLRSGTISLLR